MKRVFCVLISILLFVALCACAQEQAAEFVVMLEKSEAFTVDGEYSAKVSRGGSVSFALSFNEGYYYAACNADAVYEDGVLTIKNVRSNKMVVVKFGVKHDENGSYTVIAKDEGTLYCATPDEGYSFVGWYNEAGELFSYANNLVVNEKVSLYARFVAKNEVRLVSYDANGGNVIGSSDSTVTVPFESEVYLYPASLGSDFFTTFEREGYFPTEYNYSADGSGKAVSLGSRVLCDEDVTLYVMWEKLTPEAQFSFESVGGEAAIKSYNGDDDVVVIPEYYGDLPVTRVLNGAFSGKSLQKLVITTNVASVEDGAFVNCSRLKTLYLCDNIKDISDESFVGSSELSELRMIAVLPPTYSDNLVGTLVRRIERLYSLRNSQKPSIVFYGGSGMYHSIDGATLDRLFDERFNVINAGQNVHICGPFMLEVLSFYMKSGDILVYAPEYHEAIYSDEWTIVNWIALESFYDALRSIDIRAYKGVITSFSLFQRGDKTFSFPAKLSMKYKSYYDYNDELDEYFTRNYQADVIEDNYLRVRTIDFNIFKKALPALERVYSESLKPRGIISFFAHSAMYEKAYSNDFTEFEEYTEYVKTHLSFPVITKLEDHIYPADNIYDEVTHLTTDGAIDNSYYLADAVLTALFTGA